MGQTSKPSPPGAVKPVTQKPTAAAGKGVVAWTQWGGPHRNFQTEAAALKDTWPASGPPVVWKRQLGGDGYSAPAVEADVLYTMYGRRNEEVVIAASATTGATLWEQVAPMTFHSDAAEQGDGPYSAPLVVGDRLFTTGVDGRLQCLEKRTGKVLWTQQLWSQHRGSPLMYGYASSPIAFRMVVEMG
jgi:outer membrane protein assembly factor BamB